MPRPMSDDGARQSLRGFVSALEQAHPGEVVRITEPVDLAYQTQALALELERRRRFPLLIFEQVRGHSIPIVSNVMASRRGLASALGVDEARSRRSTPGGSRTRSSPWCSTARPSRTRSGVVMRSTLAPCPSRPTFPATPAATSPRACWSRAIPTRAWRPRATTAFRSRGRDRLGVSLHSRRRMFEYQRRAEARGQALPCAIVARPASRSCRWARSPTRPPRSASSRWSAGCFGEPLEVAPCTTIDLHVPAAAEIVIEGEILPGVREPEGPFGEFTGYFSRRSHRARLRGEGAIVDARAAVVPVDRLRPRAATTSPRSALVREAEIRNALRRVIPERDRRPRAAVGHVVLHRLRRDQAEPARARPST